MYHIYKILLHSVIHSSLCLSESVIWLQGIITSYLVQKLHVFTPVLLLSKCLIHGDHYAVSQQ
jgi:hypothetical protein